MITVVDTHCHLGLLHGRIEDIVAGAAKAGASPIVDIGMGTEESRASAERAQRMRGQVFASVGIHPNDLSEYRVDPDKALSELRGLARAEGVVGVGETGLDFYRDREERSVQEAAFLAHVALAKELQKTLVVHCRDAQTRALEVLDSAGPPERIVMHCFSGDAVHARACAERGFYCSFAGNITYKRNEELREAARALPEELLLVETDAPFLAPHPYRGQDNSPAFVPITAGVLAEVRARAFEELAPVLEANSRRAFALP